VKDFKLTFSSLGYLIQEITKLLTDNQTKAFRVNIVGWREKRSLTSNGQIHLWFGQLAKEQGYSSEYMKNACKVMFGIDVLLGSDSEQAQSVIRTLERIDYWSLDWPSKIDVVNGLMVTSLFKTDEMKVFMDQMIYYWNDLGYQIKYKD